MESQVPYGALGDATTHMRLVEVIPANNVSDKICINLPKFSIWDAPAFEIPSWSREHGYGELIDCYGRVVRINTGMHNYLRTKRRRTHVSYFWIESLCVNPEVEDEVLFAKQVMPRNCHVPARRQLLRAQAPRASLFGNSSSASARESLCPPSTITHAEICKVSKLEEPGPSKSSHQLNHSGNLFLLDRSAAAFSSATTVDDYISSSSSTLGPNSTELLRNDCALAVDAISSTSDYMPPRRHSDHYVISGSNSIIFAEWWDFILDKLPNASTDGHLLNFMDTIQARGCGQFWETPGASPTTRLREIRAFLEYFDNDRAEETSSIREFYAACYPSHGRRFATTQSKRFCLVPEATQSRDKILLFAERPVPYVARVLKNGSECEVIGEAYVEGLMYGGGSAETSQT